MPIAHRTNFNNALPTGSRDIDEDAAEDTAAAEDVGVFDESWGWHGVPGEVRRRTRASARARRRIIRPPPCCSEVSGAKSDETELRPRKTRVVGWAPAVNTAYSGELATNQCFGPVCGVFGRLLLKAAAGDPRAFVARTAPRDIPKIGRERQKRHTIAVRPPYGVTFCRWLPAHPAFS